MSYRSMHRLDRSHAGERQPRQDRPEKRTIPCEVGYAGNGKHRWRQGRFGTCEYCGKTRAEVTEYI